MYRTCLILLAVATPACDGVTCDATSATVEVGTGETAFQPLEPDDDLPFYLGPQGGYHVFVSLRATGIYGGDGAFDPDNPRVDVALESATGDLLAAIRDRPVQMVGRNGAVELVGQLSVLGHPDPPSLDGDYVELEASVSDTCGLEASDLVGLFLMSAG